MGLHPEAKQEKEASSQDGEANPRMDLTAKEVSVAPKSLEAMALPELHSRAKPRAKVASQAEKVAKERAKHLKVTKERKEAKEVYILLMPCLLQRLLLRLQLHLPNLKKKLHKPLKVHQKAQVVVVNVVLGGTLNRVVPP